MAEIKAGVRVKAINETLMEADEVVYFYESNHSGLKFEEYLISTLGYGKVKMPFIRFSRASLFSPIEPSNVIIKTTDEVRPMPLDVSKFFDGILPNMSAFLSNSGIPNIPVLSVSKVSNGGKLKIHAGRTYLHDVFITHHLADFNVANETLRDVYFGETVRFAKKVSDPVLPSPLKITLFYMSRDGFIIVHSSGNPFSPNRKELSPKIIYPKFPFGKEVVTLSDLVRVNVPEEILRGATIRVFSTHVDLRTIGEVVLGVLIATNKSAIDLKRIINSKPLPLNVVRLPKFKEFKNRKVSVMRIIAESIESFSNTIGVSYETYSLLNE